MKIHRNTSLLALAAVTLFMSMERVALAIAGPLRRPTVGLPAGYPAEGRKLIMAALQRKDCTFLRGHFVNWNSTLHYAGDAGALSGMVDDLLKCPEVKVSVQFRKLGDHGDWLVLHDAHANAFQVQINLDSQRLDLEELVLPPWNGPEIRPEPASR